MSACRTHARTSTIPTSSSDRPVWKSDGPGRGAYGLRRDHRSPSDRGIVGQPPVSLGRGQGFHDPRQIPSARSRYFSGSRRRAWDDRGYAVGGAVTPPTAFQSVSEQSHHQGRTASNEAVLPRAAYRALPLCARDIAIRPRHSVDVRSQLPKETLTLFCDRRTIHCASDERRGSGGKRPSLTASLREWRALGRRSGRLDGFGESRLCGLDCRSA